MNLKKLLFCFISEDRRTAPFWKTGVEVVDRIVLASACSVSDNLFLGVSKHQAACAHRNRYQQPMQKLGKVDSGMPLHFCLPKLPLVTLVDIHFFGQWPITRCAVGFI